MDGFGQHHNTTCIAVHNTKDIAFYTSTFNIFWLNFQIL